MASYILKALFANTCPRIRKVAYELHPVHKVIYCKGQKVIFSFESECSKDAAEHSRDILNAAIEKGLFVSVACLLKHDYPEPTKYVADWEFHRNKGYSGDGVKYIENEEDWIRWAESLNLKQEDGA